MRRTVRKTDWLALLILLLSAVSCGGGNDHEPEVTGLAIISEYEIEYDSTAYYSLPRSESNKIWNWDRSAMKYAGAFSNKAGVQRDVRFFFDQTGKVTAILLTGNYRGEEYDKCYCLSDLDWYDFYSVSFSEGVLKDKTGTEISRISCTKMEDVAEVSFCIPASEKTVCADSGLKLQLFVDGAECISCVFPVVTCGSDWFLYIEDYYYLTVTNEILTGICEASMKTPEDGQ